MVIHIPEPSPTLTEPQMHIPEPSLSVDTTLTGPQMEVIPIMSPTVDEVAPNYAISDTIFVVQTDTINQMNLSREFRFQSHAICQEMIHFN